MELELPMELLLQLHMSTTASFSHTHPSKGKRFELGHRPVRIASQEAAVVHNGKEPQWAPLPPTTLGRGKVLTGGT